MTDLPGKGAHLCSYVVQAAYPGKTPFYIGTFTIPRRSTFAQTEADAEMEKGNAVRRFFDDCFPDEVTPPLAVKAVLGHVTFVPDDYEWRRTK